MRHFRLTTAGFEIVLLASDESEACARFRDEFLPNQEPDTCEVINAYGLCMTPLPAIREAITEGRSAAMAGHG